ncbi:methyltransferase domain-containing protein [Heliobacterium gestii]|uniref:Methyltransferase domain-containing protein n=1 Tax=Heliomicrobium gestii TaxID=2699 RepID=A0A845LLI5_HELGE|nr:class I SAM-dependent methyltransferase [Heliomicrobium gestii]MBM7867977.1 SAM-dependent methyltransferase [Heliomicrobium gestii]MZP44243.1 methyltransferase domain-containing protein [Heliomicrobium gestii]
MKDEALPTTAEQVIEQYHSILRREQALEPETEAVVFTTFSRTIEDWLPRDKEAAILEIGCGEGAFQKFLHSKGYTNRYAFDLSTENVSVCHGRGLSYVCRHDALQLSDFPGPEQGWDLIVFIDLLEHLPKQELSRFMTVVRKRLRPSGSVILQTVNMASIAGLYYRYNDLTHELGFTENSICDLLIASGFPRPSIEVAPAWSAATWLGRLREKYLGGLHRLIYLADGRGAPSIPTRNLLARARPMAEASQGEGRQA